MCLILILLNNWYTNYQFCFYSACLTVLNDTEKSVAIPIYALRDTKISSYFKQLYYQFEIVLCALEYLERKLNNMCPQLYTTICILYVLNKKQCFLCILNEY